MKDIILSSINNPHDPFNDFINWLNFEHRDGYGADQVFANLCTNLENFSEELQYTMTKNALEDFIKVDPFHLYKIVENTENSKNEKKVEETEIVQNGEITEK